MSEVDTAGGPDQEVCSSFVAAMQVLGKRWNAIIIQVIGTHRLRYSELKVRVEGISDAVLAARLAELTGCGLIVRGNDDAAKRGHYSLTRQGMELVDVLNELTRWSRRWDLGGCPGSATPRSN